jgi:hypothetical protein
MAEAFQMDPRGVEAVTKESLSASSAVFQMDPRGVEAIESAALSAARSVFQMDPRGVEAPARLICLTRTGAGFRWTLVGLKPGGHVADVALHEFQMDPRGVEARSCASTSVSSSVVSDGPSWG